MRRFRVVTLIVAAVGAVCFALWGRAPSPGPRSIVVTRQGYWQRATLKGADRDAVLAALGRLGRRAAPPAAPGPRYTFRVGSRELTYVPNARTVFAGGRWHSLPPLPAAAFAQAAAAAETAFHGELVTWSVARALFPLRTDARVVDYATGLSFWVRRLAGSRHADVQPLTAADSATMKRIYGGHWSWARRPILVEVDGHRLAASMNGMPHGAGSIPGNNFPGHFCIHFLMGEVHGSGKIDPDHLWAILTAAGVVTGRPPVVAGPRAGC